MSRRGNKKQTSTGTIDVDTFKSWLQGVEDMQGADWCPSLEQWRKIRQKIEMLESPDELPTAPPAPVYPTFPPGVRGVPLPMPVEGGSIQGPQNPGAFFNPAPPPSSLDTKPSDANIRSDGSFQSSFA